MRARILGAEKTIELSRRISLSAGQSRTVTFSPSAIHALVWEHPRLWWPYRMGEPYQHTLSVEFLLADGTISDSHVDTNGHRVFRVNGKPVLIRGGGWAPDMRLRVDPERRQAEFRYVKEMGLYTIRLEGKLEDDEFFELADREGILVMAGWACCDAWEKWNSWNEENRCISVESLRDQALRLRRHPSVFVWLNGSDNPPPLERETAYLSILLETTWPNSVLLSATGKPSEVSGVTGVKMPGPYEYVPPNHWLLDSKAGDAHGFTTETSPGPAVPPLESLQKMLPPKKLWTINEMWNFHAGGGDFKDMRIFTRALGERYDNARNAADFAWKL